MNISDDILLVQIKQGDLATFEQFATRYENKLYTIAYRYMGNYADASDLAQEAFIRIYRSINTFRGESSLLSWMARVVTNVCKDELRRRAKDNTISMDEMAEAGCPQLADSGAKSLEDIVLRREWQEEVQHILNSLSEEHRTVVVMRDIQGYSYEEIAFFLKCSMGTVKSRISRARHILKDRLLANNELLHACQGH